MKNSKGSGSTLIIVIIIVVLFCLFGSCGEGSNDNECWVCNGTGYNQSKTCPACHGTGKLD